MKNLALRLHQLHTWIQEFAPKDLEDLEVPASANDLATLNESYEGRVPDDVMTVYAWHNGGQIPDPWWELSAISEVLRIKKLHESIPELQSSENWWSAKWIPVGLMAMAITFVSIWTVTLAGSRVKYLCLCTIKESGLSWLHLWETTWARYKMLVGPEY